MNVLKTLRNKSQIFLVQKARKLESSEKYFMGRFTELEKKLSIFSTQSIELRIEVIEVRYRNRGKLKLYLVIKRHSINNTLKLF